MLVLEKRDIFLLEMQLKAIIIMRRNIWCTGDVNLEESVTFKWNQGERWCSEIM